MEGQISISVFVTGILQEGQLKYLYFDTALKKKKGKQLSCHEYTTRVYNETRVYIVSCPRTSNNHTPPTCFYSSIHSGAAFDSHPRS